MIKSIQGFDLERIKELQAGVIACITIACAATFLSNNYNAPIMVYALLIGMAFNFLTDSPACTSGIEFSSSILLRIGIALLGLRITLSDIASLGIYPVFVIVSGVIFTLFFGVIAAKIMRLPRRMGVMAGGSVAICGASAALAISSVMPKDKDTQKITIFIVISVTTLSTVAMVFYPLITQFFNLNLQQSGLFLGGTIHDVAQAVGAGYSISNEVGEVSTFIKLLRVAMLVPVVFILATCIYKPIAGNSVRWAELKHVFPYFLLGFVFFVLVGSMNVLPSIVETFLSSVSSWCLIVAIAALGIKTSLQEVAAVGWRPLVLVVSSTVFIAIYILIATLFM